MAVVPFNPYVVHARRAAREAQVRAAAAREQARQRTRLPEAPPPLPKLRVNLSPAAAMRMLCLFGLGVAGCATVAATLTMVSSHAVVDPGFGQPLLGRLTTWLASLPWLFLGLTLFAVASIERLVARSDARIWRGLSIAAVVLAAAHATGGFIVENVPPLVRVGAFFALLGVALITLREFFSTESSGARLQIAGGVMGGFAVATAPFALLGQALLPVAQHTATLAMLLTACDVLLGLVVATWTVHATLVYVRDFLPDFTIALDTADAAPQQPLRQPLARH